MGGRDAVRRFAGLEELSRAAAEELVRIAAEAIAARGRFTLALSGGETPGRLYALLAAEPYRGRVDWGRSEVFWADERAVKPDREGSNFKMAEELLLRPLAQPAERLHRIRAEAGPQVAAAEYERELARSFGVAVGGPPPAFDLLLLGMGPDGHVASLFPNSAALDERRRWVVASRAPGVFPDRVTLTAPMLAAARQVLVLVAGAAKAVTLAKVLEGPRDPHRLPAQLLLAAGRVTWFADGAAAARLAADAPATPAGAGSRLLAGDVGGTKTALATFARQGDRLSLLRQREYPSRDHPSLEEIVRLFLEELPGGRLDAACFAVAGPVARGEARTTNLPWTVEARRLAVLVGTERVKLVNDVAAAAYGMLFMAPGDFRMLRAGGPRSTGNMAVIAPGTGLGEAILFWDGARHQPIATEGGHADFAPRTDEQIELLRYLRRFGAHVSYERLLSGDGLHNLYSFLRDSGKGAEPPWLAERLAQGDRNATIAELALAGESALCVAALDLFCSVLGAEAGNLALKSFATGGVILGGGIPPKILPALERGGFLAALTDKGRLTSWMEGVPVSVALDPRAPVVGAAYLC